MARRKKRYRTGSYTSTKTGKKMWYRSSYELRLMKCLDHDNGVEGYEYETVIIEHKQNRVLTENEIHLTARKNRSYTPDFIIALCKGKKLMVEVKSMGTLLSNPTQRKKMLGEQYCKMHDMHYILWTLEDIIPYEMRLGIDMPDHEMWLAAQE